MRIVSVLIILSLALVTGCISTAPRAGGDGASRSNGNITVNVHNPAPGKAHASLPKNKAMEEFDVYGGTNIIIVGNTTSQESGKATEIAKGQATTAVSGQGTADAEGGTIEQSKKPTAERNTPAESTPAERDAEPPTDDSDVVIVEESTTVSSPVPTPPVGDTEEE